MLDSLPVVVVGQRDWADFCVGGFTQFFIGLKLKVFTLYDPIYNPSGKVQEDKLCLTLSPDVGGCCRTKFNV